VLYGKVIDVNTAIIHPLLLDLERAGYTESEDWTELVRALNPPE